MVFAILDYIRYRRRLGVYSFVSIRKLGGRLAVPQNFPVLNDLGPRHLFFYHTRDSFLSWMIMYYTASVWSHTGHFSENGRIIDATTGGVLEHPLADYFDGKSYIMIRAIKEGVLSEDRLARILECLRHQIGCGFNWLGLFRLFAYIILGAHAHYRFRYSADVMLLLVALSPLGYLSRSFGAALAVAGCLYLLIVVANTGRRRTKRRTLAEQGIDV